MATTSGALPLSSLVNSGTSTSPPAAQSLSSQLGADAFLKLLTTQLRNQDPLKPMDDTQSVAQLAQFSSVQSQEELQKSFTAFQSNFSVLQSTGLLGKQVSVSSADSTGNTSTITGTVQSIAVINGQPEFTLAGSNGKAIADAKGNPLEFTTSQIIGIGTPVQTQTTGG